MSARLLDVTPDEYHRLPGFSASLAKTLLAKSPAHARHEQLVGGKDSTARMDRGSVMHRLVLGAGKDFQVLNFDSWRTDKSKTARDEARAEGKVPILADAFESASHGAMAIMRALAARGIRLDGRSELAMGWEEQSSVGPVECRGQIDHLTHEEQTIFDLKIIDDASPSAIERSAESLGHGVQWAAYTSGHAKRRPDLAGRITMRFIFAEPEPPYAVTIVEPDGVFRELATRRWRKAVESWGRCMAAQVWPGYELHDQITAPAWALAREGYTTEER